MVRTLSRVILAASLVGIAANGALAQGKTTLTQTKTFEIIEVNGDKLIVKLPEGTKELTIPADFKFNIDGKQMSLNELKPGMKGTATVTSETTSVPVTVTEVKSGTVFKTSGSSIIVRTGDEFKQFSQGDVDKRGVKIYRHGEPAEISDFVTGDQISATIVTSKPPKIMTQQQVDATLAKAPAAAPASKSAAAKPAPMAAKPAASQGAAAPAAAEPAPAKKLPKTASQWPLLVFASLLSLGMGLGLTLRRRSLL